MASRPTYARELKEVAFVKDLLEKVTDKKKLRKHLMNGISVNVILSTKVLYRHIDYRALSFYFMDYDMQNYVYRTHKVASAWMPTALHVAVNASSCETVKYLIAMGVNINAKMNHGVTALMVAAMRGYVDKMSVLLIKGSMLNYRTEWGKTALNYAIQSRNEQAVHLLIKNRVKVNTVYDGGMTPLHQAAELGLDQIVRSLLQAGAKLDARTHDRATALHYAVALGHLNVIRMLIECGAKMSCLYQFGVLDLPMFPWMTYSKREEAEEIIEMFTPDNNWISKLYKSLRSYLTTFGCSFNNRIDEKALVKKE